MPRLDFDEGNRKKSAFDFPKLKFTTKDEKFRILVIEKQPIFEYVHNLKAPKIVNNIPVEETVTKDGVSTTKFVLDFVGRPVCLGDLGILEDDGIDPKNCPMCQLATEGDLVDIPQRRFAVNVLRYGTNAGTFTVRDPFIVEPYVWIFNEKIYSKLLDYTADSPTKNLQNHDLMLKVTNPMFHQYDVDMSQTAEWQASDDRRAMAIATFKNSGQPEEVLSNACGRKSKRLFIDDDLAKVKTRWAIAQSNKNQVPSIQTAAQEQTLDAGLDDLLTQQSGSPSVSSSADDDAFGAEAAKSLGKPGSSGESLGVDDLDSLLDIS
jgi:hypothetical protein